MASYPPPLPGEGDRPKGGGGGGAASLFGEFLQAAPLEARKNLTKVREWTAIRFGGFAVSTARSR